MIITIDGPSGSGKGTLAKSLSKYFNIKHLDTGRLYRTIGLICLKKGINTNNIKKIEQIIEKIDINKLNNPILMKENIAEIASKVAMHAKVRIALHLFQKKIILIQNKENKGIIIDGRDTGSKICPTANFKFFLKADTKIRAKRRFEELICRKTNVIYKEVLKNIIYRDRRDSSRIISPLIVPNDAIILDSSYLSINQVFQRASFIIKGEKTI